MGTQNHWIITQQPFEKQQIYYQMKKLYSFNMCPGIWDGMEQNWTPGDVAAGDESDRDRKSSL